MAVKRASMAFAEILEANGPIDHSAPVIIPYKTQKARLGDYFSVVRGDRVVAEVAVEKIGDKEVHRRRALGYA